jgi:hypothetical protein
MSGCPAQPRVTETTQAILHPWRTAPPFIVIALREHPSLSYKQEVTGSIPVPPIAGLRGDFQDGVIVRGLACNPGAIRRAGETGGGPWIAGLFEPRCSTSV